MARSSKRADLLDFAVLGLLHEGPMHGYELRKRLNTALGAFRALSYGSLYPCLRELLATGWVAEASDQPAATAASRRARIVYELTAAGKERFQDVAGEAGPTSWDDDEFDVHFAFFARTTAEVRLRILEGRRSRLEERLANVRAASARNRERADAYTAALQRHGEESVEREVRWLEELISAERNPATPDDRARGVVPGTGPSSPPPAPTPASPHPRGTSPAGDTTHKE